MEILAIKNPSNSSLISLCMVFLMAAKGFISHNVSAYLITRYEKRTKMDNVKKMKLRSACWKFLYYLYSTIYGILVLRSSSWIFEIDQYLHVYTSHIQLKYRMYYFTAASHYMNEFMVLFIDPKRKDFLQMSLHHISTLLLLGCSFRAGLLRYGLSILLIHDISDPLLELAKICVYIEKTFFANVLFFIFMCVFLISRLLIFPIFLVYPGCKNLIRLISRELTPGYLIIMVGLISLVVMHIIWSYYILKIFLKVVNTGKAKDVRSKESGY